MDGNTARPREVIPVRHALGFLLGLLLVPALLYGAAWGFVQATSSYDPLAREITDTARAYGSFAVLAAAGLVAGVIIVARWASPLVSLVPALALLGLSGYFLFDPAAALALPARVPPGGDLDDGLRTLLGTGLFALLGFALLVPTWAPRRWASAREDGADAPWREPAGAGSGRHRAHPAAGETTPW